MFFVVIITVLNIFLLLLCLKMYIMLTNGINKCSKHLVGKVVIVTGGTTGIGFETAKDLADRGAKVIIACNDVERETTAINEIISATDNKDVHFKYLDLACLASVRKFAEEIIKTEKQIDILINNAGVMETKNVRTKDGLSLGMQINYFGPFLMTNLLLPLLKASAPSRIINVSSMAHQYGKIDFENLNLENETEKSFIFSFLMKMYSNSKLCIVLMTVELARLLEGTGVTANSLHPGGSYTAIVSRVENDYPWISYLRPIRRHLSRSAWEAAQTTIYLAVSPEVSSVSGRYFSECREAAAASATRDTALAKELWEVTERLVKLK